MSQDYLSELPIELRQVISEVVSPEDIPSLCYANKKFKNQCKSSAFWSYYLRRPTIAQSQDLLHDVLVEFARQGYAQMFAYLWNTPVVVGPTELIKERRSLFEGYKEAIINGYEEAADFIYTLNPDWMKKKLYRENGGAFGTGIFKSNIALISAIKEEDLKSFVEIYQSSDWINTAPYRSRGKILSYSPTYEFLTIVNSATFNVDLTADYWELIVEGAIRMGNVDLVKDIEKNLHEDFKQFYIYFLTSPLPESDLLAYEGGWGVDINDKGDYLEQINYRFGNRKIVLDEARDPEYKIMILIHSYDILTLDELIKVFPWNECLLEHEYEDWIRDLNDEGTPCMQGVRLSHRVHRQSKNMFTFA